MRQSPSVLAPLWFLGLFLRTAHAIECVNVTIADADDAAEVRRDCTVISGDLYFAKYFNETINLDGVVEITGNIFHKGCEEDWEECELPLPFSISSSTLTEVGGDIQFKYFQGLQELSFPNLTLVQGSVLLRRVHELERLDITKLARLGYFALEAANLTSLQHERLEAFTGDNKYGAVSLGAAAVESVDSFFSYPIYANGSAEQSSVYINTGRLPNVREINFGWARVDTLSIRGNDIAVTLGTSRTTSMEIGSLIIDGNITGVSRHESVKNLTVGRCTVGSVHSTKSLELPFDQLANLTIKLSKGLETVKLPQAALNWEDFGLDIWSCGKLDLGSEYVDNERVWYWPEKNITSISMYEVNVSTSFFDSFLENHKNGNNTQKVLEEFKLLRDQSIAPGLDCTPFDELHARGVLPDEYSCGNSTFYTDSVASPIVARNVWHYGVAFAAIALGYI
ncbi:hypothetical protein B0J13DRAFT_594394 [Dactylonectria estremocensis]|uniref:Uncharacterized protein n=1 Tax=Dactylonectria estremocensis TaxID=1079267 RepID=A0A9P9EXW7_9HYPO|nr:hypothetical protein B0J13DRAFT_594394 [Dactylonectria estremocensis]